MHKYLWIALPVILLTFCSNPEGADKIYNTSFNDPGGGIILNVTLEQGTVTRNPLIYVIWIENSDTGFLQNIVISKKLIKGGLTGTALPYWKINRYPKSDTAEVDAVTGATRRFQDFSVSARLKNQGIRKFNIYCEVDRSFDANDWFTNQPALLYTASVNLDKPVNEYELKLCGWTPNEITENIIPDTPKGKLQRELRYIINFKNGNNFGDIDTDRQAANMIKRISLKIIR